MSDNRAILQAQLAGLPDAGHRPDPRRDWRKELTEPPLGEYSKAGWSVLDRGVTSISTS
jgi:hypothetical protein